MKKSEPQPQPANPAELVVMLRGLRISEAFRAAGKFRDDQVGWAASAELNRLEEEIAAVKADLEPWLRRFERIALHRR